MIEKSGLDIHACFLADWRRFALRLEAEGRVLVLLTDLGTPEPALAKRLGGEERVQRQHDFGKLTIRVENDRWKIAGLDLLSEERVVLSWKKP